MARRVQIAGIELVCEQEAEPISVSRVMAEQLVSLTWNQAALKTGTSIWLFASRRISLISLRPRYREPRQVARLWAY